MFYIALMAFLAAGIPSFAFTWANDDMFGKDDPVQISLDRIKEMFGGNVVLGMAYMPVDGNLFSERSIRALKFVHEVLDQKSIRAENDPENPLGLLTEVESLINVTYIEALGDNVRFRDFIGEKLPVSQEESLLLYNQAINEPEYPRVLIADNKNYGMLLLRTDLDAIPIEEDDTEVLKVLMKMMPVLMKIRRLSLLNTDLKIMLNLKKPSGIFSERNVLVRTWYLCILAGVLFIRMMSGLQNISVH